MRCSALVVSASAVALLVPSWFAGPAQASTDPTALLSVDGSIELVVVDDFAQGAGEHEGALTIDALVTVDGTQYELPDSAPGEVLGGGTVDADLRSGDPVEVTLRADVGLTTAQALEAIEDRDASATVLAVTAAEPTDPTAAAAPASGTAEAMTAEALTAEALLPALGSHTLTVLPVFWGSRDSATQTSLAQLAAGTAAYWSEQSGGRLSVVASARPWAQIADPVTCDYTKILRDALTANNLPAATSLDHVAVYFPYRADCGGWAGRGTIRGGSIWINGLPLPDVLSHEFGHNLGIGHANTATCVVSGLRVPLSDSCTVGEYQDGADVMGYGSYSATGNLNTAFADFLGMASVATVSSLPATIDLARLADVDAVRAVKFETTSGTIYVDFRPAQGRDVREPGWAGVQVHRIVVMNGYPQTQLLDMQAATGPAFAAANLPIGASWELPGLGQSLHVTTTSATTATLSVTSSTGGPSGTPVVLTPDLTFVPMTPTRLLDTRTTTGPLWPGERHDLLVTGTQGIPADARAVALNVTAVGATSATHLRAWPAGLAMPLTSVLNTDPTRTVATAVMLGVGADNKVSIYNAAGRVDVVVDITGYYVASGGLGFTSLVAPARVLDTRTLGSTPLRSGDARTVAIAGTAGVPSNAAAVVVNVTSTDATGDGNLVAYPAGAAVPDASTVNHLRGNAATNRATVMLAGGALTVSLRGSTANAVIDVVGWFGPGATGRFTPIAPVRAFDTRKTGQNPLLGGESRDFAVTSLIGAPSDASAAVMIVTAAEATANATYATAWRGDVPMPGTSDLNASRGRDASNLAIVPWTTSYKTVRLYNNLGSTDLIGDVYGYFR